MTISHDEVRHITSLARLGLSEAENHDMAGQLQRILDYFHDLLAVPVDDVEPLTHPLDTQQNVLRPDQSRPGLANDAALANAPERFEGYFVVPPVMDEAPEAEREGCS
ncbi:MAG: Asp-tRNA(Asn)/Glu-tRNA(Gln) amidotransferase subunit GatC [Thermaerobacterales bacterium]